jgi:hypothetical protein
MLVLNRPSRRNEPGVDFLSGFGFGFEFCVLRDQLYYSLLLCLVLAIAIESSLIAGNRSTRMPKTPYL